jgi:outer membrane protein assembly factor BamB
MQDAKEPLSFRDKVSTLSGQCWMPSGIFLVGPRFAFLAYPFLLLVWVFAGTQSYAAGTSDSSKSATQEVLEHHQNPARSGLFIVPSLTWDRARNLHRDPNFHADVAGPVYAQPLYWRLPGSAKALLLVATEQNLVYALDAETGATAWKTSLGPPVPHSSLPCGNIDPLGITGTPVIDERSQAIYLDAMVNGKSGGTPKHLIFALSLKDGSVLSGWPIDVEAALKANGKTFNSSVQNQRGALTIVGETVYVPYGGHFGDCGDYRGWVVAVSLQPPHALHSWSTRARGGGVWAPGGVSSDRRGIYAATGNTIGARAWSDGEAVIRLGLDLSFSRKSEDFFAPADWQELDAVDADLGGTNPLLVTLPGATPSELVLALGKDGKAYLLDRQNLGGISGSVVVKKVSSDAIRTAPAYFYSINEVFVAFQGRGIDCPAGTQGDLTALRIAAGSPPMLSVVWCATESGRGSPIVTTTDGKANPIVWAIGAEGDNRLHGFRGDTGAVLFSGGGTAEAMAQVRRLQTLIAAGGRLYVAADQHIYAFVF